MDEKGKGKEEIRLTLEASARPISPGVFEVLAITAGEGNGWVFPAAVLQASLPLWEGATCFIDHNRQARSVRDIGGVLRDAAWDESVQGIRAANRSYIFLAMIVLASTLRRASLRKRP